MYSNWLSLRSEMVIKEKKFLLSGNTSAYSIPKHYVPVNSKTAHAPRAIPGHLTHVKLPTVGNSTQNEAHLVGHLNFVLKRLSAVGNRRFSQFFDSCTALTDHSMWVFLLLTLHYSMEYVFV